MHTLRDHLSTYGTTSLSLLELWSIALHSSRTVLPSPRLHTVLSRLVEKEGWHRITQAGLPELQAAGFSQVQAEHVIAICELSRRLAILETEPLPQIQTTGDAVRLLWPFM